MVANRNGTVVPAIFHLGGYTTIMSQVKVSYLRFAHTVLRVSSSWKHLGFLIVFQSFSPDGQLLVAASDAGIVAVFKTKELAALNR